MLCLDDKTGAISIWLGPIDIEVSFYATELTGLDYDNWRIETGQPMEDLDVFEELMSFIREDVEANDG